MIYDVMDNGEKVGTLNMNDAIPPEPPTPPDINSDVTITGWAGNGLIMMRAAKRFAGAFDSFIYNGKEFLDSADHGRLLQSAFTDEQAEGMNPTEAGSSTGTPSTLLERRVSAGYIASRVQCAYWNPVNDQILSNYILDKDIRIGHPTSQHVVQYLTTWHVPEANSVGQFEVLTAYQPAEFGTYWGYDKTTNSLVPLYTGMQDKPVIATTIDGAYAMGIYSPDEGMIFGTFVDYFPQGVTKINAVRRYEPCPAGDYSFRCYVVFGSLEDCRVTMRQLHDFFKPAPVGWQPPNQSGWVCSRPGGAFMHALRTDYGFKIGTYRTATLLKFDGQLSEIASGPYESFYQSLGAMTTTEVPAGVFKEDKGFTQFDAELGLEILQTDSGIVVFAMAGTGSHHAYLYRSTDNGETWYKWREINNPSISLSSALTDGHNVYIVGYEDCHPVAIDQDGNVVWRMTNYNNGCQCTQAAIKDGIWTLGITSIDEYYDTGEPRNAFIMYRSQNGNFQESGCDFVHPWISCVRIGDARFVAATIWTEPGFGNAELAISPNGTTTWRRVVLPMKFCMDLIPADGGVYCIGGEHGKEGRIWFERL